MGSGNWTRHSLRVVFLVLLAAPVSAQEELDVSKIRLGPAPCTLLTGAGSPESVVPGRVCDVYVRTDGTSAATLLYLKTSSGTTGWVPAAGVTGSGTADYLPKWTTATALGDSVIAQSGSNLGLGTTTTTYKVTAGGTTAPSTGYAYDLGAYLNKWLTVHAAELRVETLVATDTMATIGGRLTIAPTTQLTADLAAAGTTLSVKHNLLASGDVVRLEANGNVEWVAITQAPQGSGPYTHTITRNLDGTGANDWVAGDAVLNTGTTGDGYIDLYADHSTRSAADYGPTIVGNVRTGTTYSDLEERWAIGNLDGVFGYSATTYGAAFGSPSAAWLKIDPTNGLRIGNNTTTNVQIAADGTATLSGIAAASLVLGSAGYVRQGQTAFDTGTGFWLGDASSTPKFSLGNSGGAKMTWDGTALRATSMYMPILYVGADYGGYYPASGALRLAQDTFIQSYDYTATNAISLLGYNSTLGQVEFGVTGGSYPASGFKFFRGVSVTGDVAATNVAATTKVAAKYATLTGRETLDLSSAASLNNVTLSADTTIVVVTNVHSGGSTTITGLINGSDGRLLYLLNRSGGDVFLYHDDGINSTAANRIYVWACTTGACTAGIGNMKSALLYYDGTYARWVQITQG